MGKKVSDIAKGEMIGHIADSQNISKIDAEKIYDSLFGFISESLKEGRTVYFTGIGRFRFHRCNSRVSNLTGKVVPAHVKLKFIPNNVMKGEVKKLKKV